MIVEDGTGIEGAESYITVDQAIDYAAAHGLSFPDTTSDDDGEAACRRATAWVDATYRSRFPGYRTNRREQALEWPRAYAYDAMCPPNLIPSDEVPSEVIKATCEAAVRELASPGSLSPDYVPSQSVKQETVGPITTVFGGTGTIADVRPLLPIIDGIMATLVGSGSSSLFGKAIRG
jgi:hypothetical protein